MIAKLGDFAFAVHETGVEELTRNLELGWAKEERLAEHPLHQAVGKWAEDLSFRGTLLMQKHSTLEPLLTMAKEKQPVRLTFGSGDTFMVVIKGVSITKKVFIKEGYPLEQSFDLKLEQYFG